MSKFIPKIKVSYFYRILVNKYKFLLFLINPKIEIRRAYKRTFGINPDLENPKDLIEKIYWMELNTDTSLWTQCSDKYLARNYIKERGLEEYLPRLMAKWDKVEDINIDELKGEFVLKSNNGCGDCFVIKGTRPSIDVIKSHFSKWSKIKIGYDNSQIHYLNIKPCFIAEEFIEQSDIYKKVSPNSLVDFKFFCFNGHVESCFVVYDRNVHFGKIDLKDNNWNSLSNNIANYGFLNYDKNIEIPRPLCLDEMIEIASKLSEEFPHVRVDMYVSIDNRPIIGELTFSTGYGYFSHDYYKYLGSKVKL